MLVHARAYCAWASPETEWDFAMFALYGTGHVVHLGERRQDYVAHSALPGSSGGGAAEGENESPEADDDARSPARTSAQAAETESDAPSSDAKRTRWALHDGHVGT